MDETNDRVHVHSGKNHSSLWDSVCTRTLPIFTLPRQSAREAKFGSDDPPWIETVAGVSGDRSGCHCNALPNHVPSEERIVQEPHWTAQLLSAIFFWSVGQQLHSIEHLEDPLHHF